MKNFFENIFYIFKTHMKIFFISFASSLVAVLLIFLIISFATRGPDEPYYEEVFGELTEFRVLRIPVPEGWIYEGEPEDEELLYHMYSVLTGLLIHEDYATRRPLAVVTNNIRQALPQSGIASADIIYEVLAEGDVTRLIAIYQSYFPEKIGSVRSARDYFIDLAFNHDAIFVYHGSSPSGGARIRSTGITNLDGGRLEGQVFWRDRTYPNWARNTGTRSMEHSSYTGRAQIKAHIESQEIRDIMNDNPAYGFSFGERPEVIESLGDAHRVVVPFSQNYTRTFIFDEEESIYLVQNRDGAHMDAETEEQVAVSNILIQLTQMNVIAGDADGRRNVHTVGEGRGYLVMGGEHFPVLWEKTSHATPTIWTFENGSPLTLTPGTTWVCVFQSNGTVTFE